MPRSMDYVDVTEEFRPIWNGWFVAATEGDDDWFWEHLGEEFVYLMGGGETEPKDRTIAMNKVVQNRSYVLGDMVARRYGEVIVATGVYSARGDIPPGAAPQSQIDKYAAGAQVRFSTVWVPRDGALRCILMQSTTIGDIG